MRTSDLNSLELFRAVVGEGGSVRAARKLHRAQSNVTTRVRQLEERLGVALFRRQGRSLVLTPEGQLLVQYADRLFRLADEAQSAVQAGQPHRVFRLGSLESTAGSRLPAVLSRYHLAFPAVTVELVTGTTAALVRKVVNYELEAAFVSEPFTALELSSRPLFNEELVLITAHGHKQIVKPAELRGATLIAFASGCSYRQCLEDWLGRARVMPGRVLGFASYQAMIACVSAGTGVAIVPRSLLAALKATDDVQTHELPLRLKRNCTHLVWRGVPSVALAGLRLSWSGASAVRPQMKHNRRRCQVGDHPDQTASCLEADRPKGQGRCPRYPDRAGPSQTRCLNDISADRVPRAL